MKYKKMDAEILAKPDTDDFWYQVYKCMCVKNKAYPFLPYGLTKVEFVSHPISVEVAGWGRLPGPTCVSLVRRIVRAYEESKTKKWESAIASKTSGK